MSRLTGWWHQRSDPARIEWYTRGTFHSFIVVECLTPIPAILDSGGTFRVQLTLFGLVVVHALLCGVLSARALDWVAGRREQPLRLAVVVGTATGALDLLVMVERRLGLITDTVIAATVIFCITGFGVGALVLAQRGPRRALVTIGCSSVGVTLATVVVGLGWDAAAGMAIATLLASSGFAFTYGFSAWILRAVWELDEARQLQARLAVAEERLRFGRDLHDVMGRNLSVIALKSELAVQLARRGRPEAVEQMIEVQRIAQESQREVRDVVRGYREADLAVELAGAQSVLRAAGVVCRVEGDDGAGLPADVQSALGWVVREAATNVLRHGDARSCAVRLRVPGGGERVVLVVENDGTGSGDTGGGGAKSGAPSGTSTAEAQRGGEFTDGGPDASAGGVPVASTGGGENAAGKALDPAGDVRKPKAYTRLPGPGAGLAGLRERLGALGGTLTAGPHPGGVFRLTAEIPLPPAEESPAVPPAARTGGTPAGRRTEEASA
ncbi:sensor histidine kinase [Streptomyces sp. NPDC048639]|uniref:sensor histidine kinase n=1 Tax=Streptomyces sp. NPDC048639 TaxID=3365581 RepID=UPI0037109ABD